MYSIHTAPCFLDGRTSIQACSVASVNTMHQGFVQLSMLPLCMDFMALVETPLMTTLSMFYCCVVVLGIFKYITNIMKFGHAYCNGTVDIFTNQ